MEMNGELTIVDKGIILCRVRSVFVRHDRVFGFLIYPAVQLIVRRP